jgi:DNA-binding MarR family transcriptional regulator
MGLGKCVEKLAKYYARLDAGKARKIKPSHVQKVIDKLEAYERGLQDEIQATRKPDKKDRLERKRTSTLEQLEKARWLMSQIT